MRNQEVKILSNSNKFCKRKYKGTICNIQKNDIVLFPHKFFTLNLNKADFDLLSRFYFKYSNTYESQAHKIVFIKF